MNRPVTITIDVLAVTGLDAAQARVFGAALEHELARLLDVQGLPPATATPGVRPSLTLDDVTLGADQPQQAGGAVARAIYRGLAQ